MPSILITGANQGLGLEFTRQYAADGWTVIACCRTPESADSLAELAADHDTISIEKLDIRDHAAIGALGQKYTNMPLDILLNNAGIIGPIPIAEHIERQHFGKMDYEVWRDVIETNTFAPVKMAETFIDNLAAGEQKKLVNISSQLASITERIIPAIAYSSSKTALNRTMTIIADQLKERGIIVAIFCPGQVKTRMDFGSATVEIEQSISALRPLIAALTLDDTGSFRDHEGRTIAW
ncbi:MAG: SDR family oxidoreductase [Gammaproteobacteria bacterium]|jgi:NAD(P)-dependent dehydrogenase (short-subunit alcohol dehydrogenase family)|nr:short-chain dehydrogenase [Chromatiales bacterium]MDP6675892.1 SDR family oxidoreductase [Gammaproteobacteria bacterium]